MRRSFALACVVLVGIAIGGYGEWIREKQRVDDSIRLPIGVGLEFLSARPSKSMTATVSVSLQNVSGWLHGYVSKRAQIHENLDPSREEGGAPASMWRPSDALQSRRGRIF